ncbi:putative RNA-dependent RNA polymerase 5 [Camellia lanceoleosa]|uniref:RNA-dependent RNA polymerase 5 n=1 Tax=Camellia lanceoleosa TaxID=1840588 RepID=A0ACC0HKZ2_9ERIC|nr:putative RNA-dependent RNA polymerase 5 [Camellia lanceoleosa]
MRGERLEIEVQEESEEKLPERTIRVRASMIKVEVDSRLSNVQTFNSLEIVGISNKPKKNYLSRNLIALLSYGGVPKEYFLDILTNTLEDAQCVCSNKHATLIFLFLIS